MSNPIESIDGSSPKDMIEKMQVYQTYMESGDSNSTSSEFASSDHCELTSVEDSSPLEKTAPSAMPSSEDVDLSDIPSDGMTTAEEILTNGNEGAEEPGEKIDLGDDDKDGIPNYLDTNDAPISEATQAVLEEILTTDTDGDGILDYLDRTGGDSQIKQAYDEEAERAASPENMRAFMSLMSMFKNLDLTALSGKFTENGGESLASMAIAGMAQTAMTHSANLQEPPKNTILKKQDVKKAIEQYKNQSNKEKRANLAVLDKFIDAIPDGNPMKTTLKAARKPKSPETQNPNVPKKNTVQS
ncbi:MAG: hypothetical protein LBI77_03830 [Puniceicoccales bacterium]|jgi:hypothetical protein|nr:hypothetical protein [Puniceicoccales bacterium]